MGDGGLRAWLDAHGCDGSLVPRELANAAERRGELWVAGLRPSPEDGEPGSFVSEAIADPQWQHLLIGTIGGGYGSRFAVIQIAYGPVVFAARLGLPDAFDEKSDGVGALRRAVEELGRLRAASKQLVAGERLVVATDERRFGARWAITRNGHVDWHDARPARAVEECLAALAETTGGYDAHG